MHTHTLRTLETRCITANVLQTNKVDAQCDKPAIELSWQRFSSKVSNFQQPHLHLTYPTCICGLRSGDPVWVLTRFSASENYRPSTIVRCCFRDPAFSRLSRTPTCNRQTDCHGQTDTRQQIIPALASVSRAKTIQFNTTRNMLKSSLQPRQYINIKLRNL